MKYNQLGKTDVKVSEICAGTMVWGNEHNLDKELAFAQLDMAFAHGVNFVDVAEAYAIPPQADTYGDTERIVGEWMKARGNRSEVILATKVTGPSPFHWIRNGEGLTPDGIRAAVEGSLDRLGTDYIDLYQLHWPQRPVQLWGQLNYDTTVWKEGNAYESDMLAVLQVLKELQDAGKVRHFGLSNETAWGTMKFLELAEKYRLPRMVSIQNAYNLNRRDFEVNLSEVALQEKVGLLAYSTLAGGILTGKYQGGALPEGSRYTTWGDRMWYYANPRSFDAVQQYMELAQELGLSVTQLSLAWVNQCAFVTSNIIGTRTLEQMEECLSSATMQLSEETIKKVNLIHMTHANPSCW